MENPILILAVCAVTLLLAAIAAITAVQARNEIKKANKEMERTLSEIPGELRLSRQETVGSVNQSMSALGQAIAGNQQQMSKELTQRQDSLQKAVSENMRNIDAKFVGFTTQSEQQLAGIRATMETRMRDLQRDNNKQLEQMRSTVDEKLQKTLESRISQSFQLVNERLEQVYKGLGEMQTLATGVGDLKKVLSNVKTRGVLGEVQLGAILEQILAPDQYEQDVATKQGSRDRVEFAVMMPGDGEMAVRLPIDAKFPVDAYEQLMQAYEDGDKDMIKEAGKLLSTRIKGFAKDIRDKYIDPPYTTDFAIMFLPFEGLYAQVLQLGLLEVLQRDYKVNIAGPTTMAALLNSLQMGFRTLAIQKRSGEVWEVLGAVKTEFERFEAVLGSAQKHLDQVNTDLDKLVGVRTRQIQRRLAKVSAVSDDQAQALLDE